MSGRAHFFVTVVTVASILFIMRLVRTRQLRAKYSILWVFLGVALAVLAASPGLLDRVSNWLGVAYPPTTLFIVAITLLLLIVVHFSWELSRLEERTRVLAEELAILGAEKDGDKKQVEIPLKEGDVGLVSDLLSEPKKDARRYR